MAKVSTPLFTNPPTSGQLTNFHGANTGADAIPVTTKYRGPGGPSGARVTIARTGMNNQPLGSPQLAWESAWVGDPATSPLPVNAVFSCNGAVNYFGRIYMLIPAANAPFNFAIAGIMSAEVQGANVGAWRWETPVRVVNYNTFNDPQYISDSVNSGAICYVGNWLYVLGQTGIYYSYVLPDGSLTNWALGIPGTFEAGSMMASMQVSPQTFPGWVGKLTVICNRGGTNTFTYDVTDTGAMVNAAVISTAMPNQRGWGAAYIDPYGGLYVIGGEDAGGNPSTMVQFNFYNFYTNTATGWGTTTALPFARSRFGFALQTERTPGTTDIYVCGGMQTLGGPGLGTVYTCQGTVNSGGAGASLKNGTATWVQYTNALPTITKGCAAAMSTWGGTNKPTTTQQSAPPGWPAPIYPYRYDSPTSTTVPQISLIVLGGFATGAVQVSSTAANTTGLWYSGTAPIWTSGSLGTGSVITANADGTYTLTFNLAANNQSGFGLPKALATLLDGDTATISVQFVSSASGDVSAAGTTTIKVGQPPTISAVSPANAATPNNGNPPLSFTYNLGAGGAAQSTTRIQVKQAGTTIYDSGLRQGAFNSLAAMPIAPLLLPSTAYTLIIDVTSLDTPVAGSSAAGTSSTTFTPTAFTRLGAPGSFTATADSANARIALAWGAVGSATGYNVYHRRTAVGGTWYLLSGNVAGTSFTAMDRIAAGVGYDFVVTTLSAVPAESVNSSTQSATIGVGNWSAYLHIAGNGATYGVPFQVQGSPTVLKKRGALQQAGFGQAAPVARYGTANYHTIAAKAILIDATPATLNSLSALIAQVEAGNTAWWRDALGGMVLVTVDTDQGLNILPPWNREVDLKLTETDDVAQPLVLTGSASGYQTAVNGNRPPLDLSERLL